MSDVLDTNFVDKEKALKLVRELLMQFEDVPAFNLSDDEDDLFDALWSYEQRAGK